jgi:hypothetical protein
MKPSAGNSKKIVTLALSLSASLALSLPVIAATVSDPAQFILQYYAAKAKTKFPLEVHGFFSKRIVASSLSLRKSAKKSPKSLP